MKNKKDCGRRKEKREEGKSRKEMNMDGEQVILVRRDRECERWEKKKK